MLGIARITIRGWFAASPCVVILSVLWMHFCISLGHGAPSPIAVTPSMNKNYILEGISLFIMLFLNYLSEFSFS